MMNIFKRRKKFSLENLKYLCTVLEKNPKITEKNQQLVIETLRQIAELMIYGDQNDESFFLLSIIIYKYYLKQKTTHK